MIRKIINNLFTYLMIGISVISTGIHADTQLDPRVQIGLNLFPAVIAANKSFIKKNKDQPLTIYIIYLNNEQLALKARKQLEKLSDIRGHKLVIKTIRYKDISAITLNKNDALFLLEKKKLNLTDIIRYALTQKVILFSPFTEDVEKGVMSGFIVSNKVLPAINLKSMKASNIDLKAFFLRIAVKFNE